MNTIFIDPEINKQELILFSNSHCSQIVFEVKAEPIKKQEWKTKRSPNPSSPQSLPPEAKEL